MTGMPQQTGNVSIYPVADPANDLVPVDPAMAYQPLATILEAAKYQQNKATGWWLQWNFRTRHLPIVQRTTITEENINILLHRWPIRILM